MKTRALFIRTGVAGALVALLLALSATEALAQTPTRDVRLGGGCEGTIPTGIITEVDSRRTVVATFTASKTTTITRADVFLSPGFLSTRVSDVRLDIRAVGSAGVPSQTVLATSSVIPASTISTRGGDWETARFSPGVPVVAGQKYALGLRILGTDTDHRVWWRGIIDSDPVVCSNNLTFISDGGGAFYEQSSQDNYFRLFETVDKVAPVANNDSYATGEYATLDVAAPGVLGNDTDADGDAMSAVVTDAPDNGTVTLNPNGSFSYTPDDHFEGVDTFSYSATDTDGLGSAPATVSVAVSPDNQAPTVSLDAPEAQSSLVGSVDLKASASDNGRVKSVEFLVDGDVVETDDSAPYEAAWDSTLFSEGTHRIEARAVDAAGNQATSEARPVMVDNLDPESTITDGPAEGSFVNSTSASFSFVSTDGDSFGCQLDALPIGSCDGDKILSSLSQGGHTFRVWAVGSAGRDADLEAEPSVRNWTVDTVVPSGTVKINNGAGTARKLGVTLNLAAADPAPGSGLGKMRFSNDGRAWSAWKPYAATSKWSLKKGKAGTRMVFAQFVDGAGNVSATVKDTVRYKP